MIETQVVQQARQLTSEQAVQSNRRTVRAQLSIRVLEFVACLCAGTAIVVFLGSATAHLNAFGFASVVSNMNLSTTMAWTFGGLGLACFVIFALGAARLKKRELDALSNNAAQSSGDLARAYLSQPISKINQDDAELVGNQLTRGVSDALVAVQSNASNALNAIATIAAVTAFLVLFVPVTAALAACVFAVYFVLLRREFPARDRSELQRAERSAHDVLEQAIGTYREALLTNTGEQPLAQFALARDRVNTEYVRRERDETSRNVLAGIVVAVTVALVFAVQSVLGGVTSALTATACLALALAGAIPAIRKLDTSLAHIAHSRSNVAALLDFADQLPSPVRAANGNDPTDSTPNRTVSLATTPTAVEFRRVSFTYPGDKRPTLQDISFQLRPGEKISIIAEPGAGKTTLMDLVIGALSADHGKITAFGASPRGTARRHPGMIACIPQDVQLIKGTIRDNVALNQTNVDDDDIWDMLRLARLARFVEGQPTGLDTLLGQGGVRLSEAKTRRLALARALYTRPRLLVVDQGASPLDPASDAALARTLRELGPEVAVIMCTGHAATAPILDRYLSLSEGTLHNEATPQHTLSLHTF